MQDAVEMSTYLLGMREDRREAVTSDKALGLVDNTALCILALLYENGNLFRFSFPCTFYRSSVSYS
jgi:hypothetical protein